MGKEPHKTILAGAIGGVAALAAGGLAVGMAHHDSQKTIQSSEEVARQNRESAEHVAELNRQSQENIAAQNRAAGKRR